MLEQQRQERSVVLLAAATKALASAPLTKVEGAVFWHLVRTLPVAGDIVSLAALGETLAITAPQMTRALQRLAKAGFLMRGVKVGVSYHWKLNPALVRIL